MSILMIIVLAWIAISATVTAMASVFLRAAARADANTDRLARSELGAMLDRRSARSSAREFDLAPSRRLHATLN